MQYINRLGAPIDVLRRQAAVADGRNVTRVALSSWPQDRGGGLGSGEWVVQAEVQAATFVAC